MCNTAVKVGNIINMDIFEDSKNVTCAYKTYIETIGNNSKHKQDWLEQRNPLLLSIIQGCTNVEDTESISMKISNALVDAIEQILYTRNLMTVTPICVSMQHNSIYNHRLKNTTNLIS